jgi:hypothetical protein
MGGMCHKDIRALGMKNTSNVATNRENWLKLLRKAKVTQDCQTDDDNE